MKRKLIALFAAAAMLGAYPMAFAEETVPKDEPHPAETEAITYNDENVELDKITNVEATEATNAVSDTLPEIIEAVAAEEETEEPETSPPADETDAAPDIEEELELTIAASNGTCGANLTWMLDNEGTLTISGTGAMYDYRYSSAPWYSNHSSIKGVI